jgi:dipeptidyl aminopeptidase/acylaminoacyl peptidase
MCDAHRRACPLACVLVALFAAAAAGQGEEKRPLTPEDLWKVQRVGKPALSPDGKWVVVEVTTYSIEENDSFSQLWLLAADGTAQRPLKKAKANNSGPVWSPDGKSIAFVGKDPGKVGQVYLIEPGKDEPKKLSSLPMSPSGLRWSKDGRTVYCIVQTWPDTPDDAAYRKRVKERQDSKVRAYVIEDALFRIWDHWVADGKRPVVFAIDARTGKHRNLFAGVELFLPLNEPSASHYDVSPDGSELCFVAESVKELGTDSNLDLYVMPTDRPGKPRCLTADNPAGDNEPAYAPDGKSIAFTRQTIKMFYADRSRIMLHDRASGKNRELTANFDRSCHALRWAPKAAAIYFEAEDKGYVRIFKITPKGNDVAPLTAGFTDRGPSLSRDGKTLAFQRSSFDLPAAAFVMSLPDGKPRQIDRFNERLVASWDLGKVEDVTIKGADDKDVQMWVVYPPGFDPKKRWPLLQVVHGGPHNAITTDFHYRWNLQALAARGYVVGCVNFHGSSGFGQAFTDSITGDVGTKPMIDVMKATDWFEKQPYIDPMRLAAAGASYGGYMMAWLNGHTDRFKAMVCHAGVYNWHSMMASDLVRDRERRLGALPWQDLDKIDRQSPQRLAGKFKTPTLVIHGERDFRVPLTQGLEYYNTLRLKGVPTRLLYFPDENHWILKPQNSLLWHRELFAWLDRYVGHGPSR